MTNTQKTPIPVPTGGPSKTWDHRDLYDNVISALYALPSRFQSPLVIEGVPASDLFTMNTPLGAAIEASVVTCLNDLRVLWDPKNKYTAYSFVRQSQTFPDVLLRSNDPRSIEPILMGIELKGWFAVAKEGEPSFRYFASAACCAPQDLLIVVPWVFDSVVSGKPRLLSPIVVEAAHAACMRNYHWEFIRRVRDASVDRGVTIARHTGFYPAKNDQYSDQANSDAGKNFGRVARCGVMDSEVDERLREQLLGIPIDAWRRFLQIFAEGSSESEADAKLRKLEDALAKIGGSQNQLEASASYLEQLAEAIRYVIST